MSKSSVKSYRRALLRPMEMVIGSVLAASFISLVVVITLRDWRMTAIVFLAVFVICLVVCALLVMGVKPTAEPVQPDDLTEVPK